MSKRNSPSQTNKTRHYCRLGSMIKSARDIMRKDKGNEWGIRLLFLIHWIFFLANR